MDFCNKKKLLPRSNIPWQKGRLERLLKNPFYCGWFEYPRNSGNLYEGSHEPYFSKKKYDRRLARIAANRNGTMSGRKNHLLSKFVRCSKCGRFYIGELQHGGHDSGEYAYYKHLCRGQKREWRVKEEDILLMVDESAEALRLSPDFAENLKSLFRGPLLRQNRHSRKEINLIAGQLDKFQSKKSRLLDLYANESIDQGDLAAKHREYDAKSRILQARLDALMQNNDRVFRKIACAIDLIRELPEKYLADGKRHEKIKFLKTMADGLVLTPEGSLRVAWQKPFSLLARDELLAAIEEESLEPLERPSTGGGFNTVPFCTRGGT